MNTLRELISELYLEASQLVSDDTVLDDRLLIQFINKQRSLWVRNELNKNRTIDPNITQFLIRDIIETDSQLFLYRNDFKLYRTDPNVTTFIELHHQPGIISVQPYSETGNYNKKLPFSIIDPTHIYFIGSGKFNTNKVFCYLDSEFLYLMVPKQNKWYNDFNKVKITGIFEDPTKIDGFNIELSKYPISAYMWNYIKAAIINEDLRNYYVPLYDPKNDSSQTVSKVAVGNEKENKS